MKNDNRLDTSSRTREHIYKFVTYAFVVIMAFFFLFPLYWIITGAFKAKAEIIAPQPSWWPKEWVMTNFENLMSKRTAPLYKYGYGNAMGVILAIIIAIMSAIQFKLGQEK